MRAFTRMAEMAWFLALASAPLPGQYALTTLFNSNSTGSNGGLVYFDITVTNSVRITAFDMNFANSAGVPVGLQVYTTSGSYAGREFNPGAWILAASDDGRASAAGQDQPTAVRLASPFILAPGSYGVALEATFASHAYTRGDGSNQSYADANLALQLGAAQNRPWSGATSSPRVWNGTIYYGMASGLNPDFSATPTAGPSPLTVRFTDRTYTSDPGGVTSWAWDFQNDGAIDSTAQNPSFTYASCGSYDVSLTVTDASHPPATWMRPGFIIADPQLRIGADFLATPRMGLAPLQVQFHDTSSGTPTAWAWDLDGDGTVDSSAQNPTFTYTSVGRCDVTLTASNACGSGALTRSAFIEVLEPTANTRSAEVLQYNFDEPRGDRVFNSASSTLAPAYGTVAAATWPADPGRALFMGNQPGSGCLGIDASSPYDHWVDSGWPLELNGSITIMFWQRVINPPGGCYAFGVSSGGNARDYSSNGLHSLRDWGPVPRTSSATDLSNASGWQHLAIVIDDTAGSAQWFLNAVADGAATAFTPSTFAVSMGNFLVACNGTSSSVFTRYYEMDDFRLYLHALTPAEIQAAMAHESAAATLLGDGCPGPSGASPGIRASSAPTLGNQTFNLLFEGAEAGRSGLILIGIDAALGGFLPLPIPLLGPGCALGLLPEVSYPQGTGAGSGSIASPIPADPFFAGAHGYVQMMILGSAGAFTPVLDINIQP